MASPTTTQDFLKVALDRAEKEFALLSDTWKHIDTKAQATATVGGIFLAAAFSFVRNTSLVLRPHEQALLSLTLLMLVASIVLAVVATLVKPASGPWSAAQVTSMNLKVLDSIPKVQASGSNFIRELVLKALGTDEKSANQRIVEARYVGVLADMLNDHSSANDRLRAELKQKSKLLRWAQGSLLASAVFVTVLTLVAIFTKRC